jgi:YVTN family beta-propeller protein
MRIRFLILGLVAIVASQSGGMAAELRRLPTGLHLDPVSVPHPVGNFPLAMAVAPGGGRVALLLCGWRQQGVQIVDPKSGAVLQTLPQIAAFLGLTFSPDGKMLYASGGNDDSIFVYRWNGSEAVADGKIVLAEPPKPAPKPKDPVGTQYPAGIAISRDGRFLYVAENLADTVAVVDLATRSVIQRLQTDRYPYAVAIGGNEIYVSAWGERTVDTFHVDTNGTLRRGARIATVRHPAAMAVRGSRLYVASPSTDSISVIDMSTDKVVNTLTDSAPSAPREGSTPNALAFSRDGRRMFVAEADSNAVAVFDTATRKLLGRVPVEWYPSALAVDGDEVIVASAKGPGSRPNPARVQPGTKRPPASPDYTLGQLDGSIVSFPANLSASKLASATRRVAHANGWGTRQAARYPPFKHVIYIIKENRTYDQIFGDMKEGDGDPSLLFFGEEVSPNHHALARRFGLFDRFFVNAEVSPQGHNWSMGAYTTDYLEKTVPSNYSTRGRSYDYEGSNRNRVVDDDDDVSAPANGFLWDLAARKKITLRNYGEFVANGDELHDVAGKAYVGLRHALRNTTSAEYPGFNLNITDQTRFDVWLAEFRRYVADGSLPALEIVRLPNDHTNGSAAGKPTPRAYVADNDLALGHIVEAVSHSQYWRDTAIFVLEDDAQDGPDHVDSHRSLMFVISAWNRGGVMHRFVNTTDVLATMEEILGLGSMSQFDRYGRPLRDIFAAHPTLTPYDALKPAVDMGEKNPENVQSKQSAALDFSRADAVDDDTLNRILWRAIKGDVPYPGPTRAAVRELIDGGR